MMTNVLLDTHLFLLPNPCRDAMDLERFVDHIMSWKEAAHEWRYSRISKDVIEELYAAGEYPFPDRLRDLIRQFKIVHFDHETIIRVVQQLLDEVVFLEETIGLRTITCEVSSDLNPKEYFERLPDRHKSILFDSLAKVTCHQENLAGDDLKWFFGTESVYREDCYVTGKLDIVLIEPDNWNNIKTPIAIETKIPIVQGHLQFLSNLNPLTLWGEAENPSKCKAAINVAIQKLIKNNSGIDLVGEPFDFGGEFLESAKGTGCTVKGGFANVLISTCASIVANCCNKKTRPLRNAKANNSGTKLDDEGFPISRVQLGKGKQALRLMYAVHENKLVVFHEVSNKGDV